MKKKADIIFIAVLLLCLAAFPVLTFVSGKNGGTSLWENRSLAQRPELTAESVFSGDYFDRFETYLKDNAYKRDQLLKLNTAIQKFALLRVSVNEIIAAPEALLPYNPPKFAESSSDADVNEAVGQLAALKDVLDTYGGKLIYVGIPGQASTMASEYPEYLSGAGEYFINTEEKFASALAEEGVPFIRGRDILTRDMYFKTDHHYNIPGAFEIYREICRVLEVKAMPEENIEFYELPNPVLGSRAKKIYDMTGLKDKLTFFDLKEPVYFERWDYGSPVEASVILTPSNDYEPVQYGNYMSGDQGETVIKTNRPELPSVLIYGDSFTNAVECFLYMSFDEMRSIDMRYYSDMTVCEYAERYKPDYVICLRDDSCYCVPGGNGTTN